MIDIFESRYKVKIRGTLLDDFDLYGVERPVKLGDRRKLDIEEEHIACMRRWLSSSNLGIKEFIPSRVIVLQHVERNGRRYQRDGPNSSILFSPSDAASKAGQILLLFSYLSHTFAIIRPFRQLEDSYCQFDFTLGLADAAGYLSSAEMESTLILVPFSNVLSHFTSISVNILGIERPMLHILPL